MCLSGHCFGKFASFAWLPTQTPKTTPPTRNANFAWVQHFIYHLSTRGKAGYVLANGSLTAENGTEGEIRKQLIENNLVECIVAMPDKLFYNTGIPACLWFLNRNKQTTDILFVDARQHGSMKTRNQKEFVDSEIQKIGNLVKDWQLENGNYEDVKGFCKVATVEEVKNFNYILSPGRYVGTEETEEDETLYQRMKDLTN